MTRPSLEPIAVVGPPDLNISISRDRSPTASPAADSDIPTCTSPPKSPPSEPLPHPLPKCTSSPSRKRQPSRRQSSISYLPADSPRLWTPRTPQTGSDFLERSPSLAGKKEGHVRARSQVIPHRPPSEPVVLTLAERHADLLQIIAQKESECLELRSQLAIHESELLDLKRKWERIVRREFGRTVPSPTSSTSTSTSTSTSAPSAALALANTSSAAVLNGLVGGVRALAATPVARSRALSSSSSTAFAKQRMARQAASISAPSPTATTATTTSSSGPSTDGSSPRLSQSSMSSVAEEKTALEKAERPPGEDVEGAVQASALGSSSSSGSTKRPLAGQRPQLQLQTQQQEGHHHRRLPSSSELPPSASSKTVRRRSRDLRAPLADALKPLTGRGSGKRVSISVISPTSMSISGINPLGAMGLGRANLGEAAQGWVDSVGSKLAELQRGETFSKGQKRASVLLSDVSQSIFSALAPASAPPTPSLIDDDDGAGSSALGSALLPDVVSVAARAVPPKAAAPPTPEKIPKDEEDEDWNW